jgi:AcrR family transcriptional regulator
LLERAYAYCLERGLSDMSLRPLAAAVGSSPRVLLFLFGSKDGLTRALLARAREDELAALGRLRTETLTLGEAAREVWKWLAADEHRGLLRLWVEAYGRSLVEPDGPWAAFAEQTVRDWLDVLAATQRPASRRSVAGAARRTAVLAVLRGLLLDLLATGDVARTGAALQLALSALTAA